MFLTLVKTIKKLKVKELKELARRLDIIASRKSSSILDLSEAVNCCNYHFDGNNSEFEICLCNCFCQNCEYIPQDKIGQRMQEIGQDITDENAIFDLIEKGYAKLITKEINGKGS